MISEVDKKIIEMLRRNSRESLAKLSKETGISLSTIYDKLKKMEGRVIKKHVSIINFAELGYYFRQQYAIKIITQEFDRLREFIRNNPHVNNAYEIAGKHDFFIDCIFKNPREAGEFKKELKSHSVNNITRYEVISEIKEEGFYGPH